MALFTMYKIYFRLKMTKSPMQIAYNQGRKVN
jgi:hypothetical protein